MRNDEFLGVNLMSAFTQDDLARAFAEYRERLQALSDIARRHLQNVGIVILGCVILACTARADVRMITGDGWSITGPTSPDPALPNILLFGDSILQGYEPHFRKLAIGHANVYAWNMAFVSTLGAKHVPVSQIEDVSKIADFSQVVFNNGLHSLQWIKESDSEIFASYSALAASLQKANPKAKLHYLATTPYTGDKVNGVVSTTGTLDHVVRHLNRLAKRSTAGAGIPYIDAYMLLAPHLHLAEGDHFHWSPAAYEEIARLVASSLGWKQSDVTTIVAEPGEDTIRPVLERICKLTPEERQRGVEVVFKPGVYRSQGIVLGSDCSGVSGAPIVWRAEMPGTVKFSTYAVVPVESFGEDVGGVLVASIESANCGQMMSSYWDQHESSSVPVPHVIVDGQMMAPATWPNEGWTNIAFFVDQGTKSSDGNTPQKPNEPRHGGTFGYDGSRPSRWIGDLYCWLEGYWCFDWSLSCIKIREINTVSNTIALLAPHVYGVRQGNPSPRRWRVRHAKAELDAPGEYYVDAREKKLYLMPPKGFDRKRSSVTISRDERVAITLKNAHDIRFENIDFTESWSHLMEIRECRRIAIENCRFYNGREKGLKIAHSSDCRVVGCDFFDLGAGGIWLGHDDVSTLKHSNNLVEDCVFRRCSRLRLTYAPGIGAFASVGATIRHCEVSDQPHIGVLIDGNDMLFEYNVISNVCYAADDASGYYAGRCPQCQGNEIRYCLFKDIRSRLEKSGMCGIYLDDGQPGHYVHHNVFVNAGRASIRKDGRTSFAGAMYTNSGFSNRCENCIFIDCIQAFSCYQQSDEQWNRELAKGIKSNGEYWRLKSFGGLALFTNRLYLAKYPMLKDWLAVYKPKSLRENTARNNVVVDCYCRNNPSQGGWDLDDTNIVLGKGEDAGFVDRAHGNFMLRPDSIIYRMLPRFTPIPFNDIGLTHRR